MTHKPSPLTSTLYLLHRFQREIVLFVVTSLIGITTHHYLFPSYLSTASLRVDPNGGSAISGTSKAGALNFMGNGNGPDYIGYLKMMRSRLFHDYITEQLKTDEKAMRKVKRIYGENRGDAAYYSDKMFGDVDYSGRENDLIDITANNNTPIDAVELSNLISEMARRYLLQYESAEVDSTIEYLNGEMRKQEETLRDLTNESEKLSYNSHLRPLPAGSPVELNLDSMERELSMMKVKVKEIEYLANDLIKQVQGNSSAVDQDPSLRGRQVDKLRDLKAEHKAYVARMKALAEEIEVVKKAHFNPTLEGKASRLQKTVASEQEILFGLRKRIFEMQLYKITLGSHVRLHSASVLETVTRKLTLPKKLTLTFALSLMAILLFLLLREQVNPTVFHALQLNETGIKPLACIPDSNGLFSRQKSIERILRVPDFTKKTNKVLPFYYISRKLQRFHKTDEPTFITTIGASPGQKAPVIAANLATALAANGARVLLVDCDTEMPSLRGFFELTSEIGLNDIVQDDLVDKFTGKTSVAKNLDVLGAGRAGQPNAQQLEKYLLKMTNQCRGKYDFIIFDAPDLKRCESGVTLGKKSDLVILISDAEDTRMRQWQEAVNTLKLHDIREIYGVIDGAEDYFLMNSAPLPGNAQENIHELQRKANPA